MKRLAACILIFSLLAALTGCQKEEPANRVGILLKENSTLDTSLLEADLISKGYETVLPSAPNDQAQQIQQVKELCVEGTKLLVIEPVISAVAEELAQPAIDAGIPVLFVGFHQAAPALSGNVSFIGYNTDTVGVLQAELLEKLPDGGDLSGDGNVGYAIITGPVDHRDVESQIEGIASVLGTDSRLLTKHTDRSYEKGYGVCADLLSDYGMDLEVIFCGSPELTQGALQAADEAYLVAGEDVYIVGMGSTEALTELIEVGSVVGSVYTDQDSYLSTISNVVFRMLEGDPYEYQYLIEPQVQ